MNNKLKIFALSSTILSLCGCSSLSGSTSSDFSSSVSDAPQSSGSSSGGSNSSSSDGIPSYVPSQNDGKREARSTSTLPDLPSNAVDETKMKDAKDGDVYVDGDSYCMKSLDGAYSLVFAYSNSTYSPSFIDAKTKKASFSLIDPAKVYIKGDGQYQASYSSMKIVRYGLIATAKITTKNGSEFQVVDRYYYPEEAVDNAINIERQVVVDKASASDNGYESIFAVDASSSQSNLEWYVPNQVNYSYTTATSSPKYRVFRETTTGLPLAMFRDKTSSFAVSLARYKPVIDYSSNSYACVGIYNGTDSSASPHSSIEINYPTRDTARRFFSLSGQVVYNVSLIAGTYASYDEAMVDVYKGQYSLQNPSIVDCSIDDVYSCINKDFKSFMLDTNKNGVHSYGLPWRVTIENGKIGPKSYQAGFVGQQIPCAYNMMVYGLKNNDSESLQNGLNIINFWINDAKMMTSAGVPMIWYDGTDNNWASYPTFLRMAVDAMEGVLDAYRLAKKYSISTTGWLSAVTACANWLVKAQNSDGSFYRCYNYQGTYYKGTEDDIGWNPGDIARSTSKHNTTIPVRFLGKMYELTGESKYLTALTKAGDYIYDNLYPEHVYYGGTCDNPDAIDKEAGVYAMYAYDTLYTLTKDEKWIAPLEQATIFTMSSVLAVRFKISSTSTTLKAANALKYGYTDGLSYICVGGTSLDNYAAYIYYELFRIYIITGDSVYLSMAEFIQENTKSTMDYDGKLGYSYKSLTPEASTIYSFGFSSAEDDDGVDGVWLPWQSAANAEPIAKMYETFGNADVATFKSASLTDLRSTLSSFGVGGHEHKSIK